MINNNILGDKLNNFKNKNTNPLDSSKGFSQLPDNPMISAFVTILSTILFVIKVLVYGYSLKIIFNTDWNYLSIVCIGLAINFLLNYIQDLISRKY